MTQGTRLCAANFGYAGFIGATFGDSVNFDDAVFGDKTNFGGATFAGTANFEGAAFGWETSFADANFKDDVEFKGKTEDQSRRDVEARIREKTEEDQAALKKRHEDSWTGSGSAPDRFLTISFANVRFDNEAVFSVRSFEADANFTSTRFYYPPDFDAVTNGSRIDFSGAHVGFVSSGKFLHWTKNSLIPVRLRAFRKIAEETKNHDLERDLYIEERKAERGVYLRQRWKDLKKDGWEYWPRNAVRLFTHILWIIVIGIYGIFSDYGRSFARPFACWLVLSLVVFPWWYDHILPVPPKLSVVDSDKYEQAVQMVARANAVPFNGSLVLDSEIKQFLFCLSDKDCHPIPPKIYLWSAELQNFLSIALFFFIALALRNYFKIK